MGSSAEGVLFWGISLGDKESLDEAELSTVENWEELLAVSGGAGNDPYKAVAGRPMDEQNAWYAVQENRDACRAFNARQSDVLDSFGAEVVETGHYEYPGIAIVVKGSWQSAEWSEHLEPNLTVDPGWQGCLYQICTALDITVRQGRWLLAACYG